MFFNVICNKFCLHFKCFHYYRYPYPCRTDIPDWACIEENVSDLKITVNEWYDTFKKPLWITEFSCIPGYDCGEKGNKEFMKQVMPFLEKSDKIFRYAWFSAIRIPMNLNEREWEVSKRRTCLNNKYLGKVEYIGDCARAAERTSTCYRPFILKYHKKFPHCYCSIDMCEVTKASKYDIFYQDDTGKDGGKLTSLGELYQREWI